MEILHSLILGVVQGLTELLPVSSSAHLTLFPWVFWWSDISESFDVALHIGTLLAIIIFFYKDWVQLIKGGYNQVVKKKKSTEGKIFWYIVIATIPTGIACLVLDKLSGKLIEILSGVLISLSQAIAAAFPGVSRSGITMTVGRKMGLERESVAKFSFLLSTPIVAAAALYELKHFVFDLSFVIGVLASFIILMTRL